MDKPTHALFIDIEGESFGMLYVSNYAGFKMHGSKKVHIWLCHCDCGNTKEISGNDLRRGTRSCGCEVAKSVKRACTTHGMKNSPEYNTWRAMKSRCNNPNRPEYKNYGGRGITVCERWDSSFENFINDMGMKPSTSHSIDRINNEKGYYPGNCRWATKKEQRNNQRKRRGYKK